VTSRSYSDATFACSEGGIYERPDKIVDWIEQQAGVPVARGPEPSADPLTIAAGSGGESAIDPNDPKSSDHGFAIATPPAHGQAKVRDDGRVRVCIDPAATGSDSVTVAVTDSHTSQRTLDITIPIAITAGEATTPCDVGAFSVGEDGGGCCDAGQGAGASVIPLSIAVAALLRRRRHAS
jgi:hypothetical protein